MARHRNWFDVMLTLVAYSATLIFISHVKCEGRELVTDKQADRYLTRNNLNTGYSQDFPAQNQTLSLEYAKDGKLVHETINPHDDDDQPMAPNLGIPLEVLRRKSKKKYYDKDYDLVKPGDLDADEDKSKGKDKVKDKDKDKNTSKNKDKDQDKGKEKDKNTDKEEKKDKDKEKDKDKHEDKDKDEANKGEDENEDKVKKEDKDKNGDKDELSKWRGIPPWVWVIVIVIVLVIMALSVAGYVNYKEQHERSRRSMSRRQLGSSLSAITGRSVLASLPGDTNPNMPTDRNNLSERSTSGRGASRQGPSRLSSNSRVARQSEATSSGRLTSSRPASLVASDKVINAP